MSDLLENYLSCWNENDPQARRELLARHFTTDATYVDPMVEANGITELDAVIAAVREQFDGFVFSPAGALDAHHSQARFTWNLGPAGGEPIIVGSDVVTLAADGRITSVLGFLDRVPA